MRTKEIKLLDKNITKTINAGFFGKEYNIDFILNNDYKLIDKLNKNKSCVVLFDDDRNETVVGYWQFSQTENAIYGHIELLYTSYSDILKEILASKVAVYTKSPLYTSVIYDYCNSLESYISKRTAKELMKTLNPLTIRVADNLELFFSEDRWQNTIKLELEEEII